MSNLGNSYNSPAYGHGYPDIGIAEVSANHQESPQASGGIAAAVVPKPPDPSVGGMPGRRRALGWSTGIRPLRHLHALFTGRTLVVPSMGAHPVEGPVGYSNRLGRLNDRAGALYANYTPDPREVAAMFTSPNPILREMSYQNDSTD